MNWRNIPADPNMLWCRRCEGNTPVHTYTTIHTGSGGSGDITKTHHRCKKCRKGMFVPADSKPSFKKGFYWSGVFFFPAGLLILGHYRSEDFEHGYIYWAGCLILIGLFMLVNCVLRYHEWLSFKRSEEAKKLRSKTNPPRKTP